MAEYKLTQSEISTILWCMESMASDLQADDESTPDFESAFAKIEAASDTMQPEDFALLIP